MVLNVKFTGDPVPERKWYYCKREIKPSGSVIITDKDHSSKLTVLNARGEDSGQFEIKVSGRGLKNVFYGLIFDPFSI